MRLLTIALFIVFPSIIFAQSNYQPGYVLKNNGDTLKGYINYLESTYSPVSIDFKAGKADNAIQQFTPNSIKAFQITGNEDYISYVGIISTNKNVAPNLPYGLDTTVTTGAIFLKPLATGKYIRLFYNSEPSKNRFFIAEENGPPVELKYHVYYDGVATAIIEHKTYRGQLQLYNNKFNSGNPQVAAKLNDAMFNEADLAHMVNLINNNGVSEINNGNNINNKKNPSAFRIFASLGANSTSTKFTYGGYNPAIATNSASYSHSLTPKFGIGADFFINPDVQRFVFRLELSYSSSSGSFAHSESKSDGALIPTVSIVINNQAFTQSSFSITPQVLVNIYNKGKLKIYADLGVSDNTFSISNNANGTFNYNHFLINYSLQGGAVLNKKVEFFVSYFTSGINAITDDYVNISNRSVCVGVKYLLSL